MIFKNRCLVEISGRNPNSIIKRMIKDKINIYSLINLSYNKIHILVSYNDYLKIKKYKTSYKIKLKKLYGIKKFKLSLKHNLVFLISILIALFSLFILSNITTDIEVIHSNKEIRNLIEEELKKRGIRKYSFMKNYDSIKKIKEDILSSYENDLEWLEINRSGTKYIVRVEERIIPKKEEESNLKNIISSKYAIIKSIYANEGEIIKNINDYVKPGDVIISGEIFLNENVKDYVEAKGDVYGDVWYHASVEYPKYYYEEIETSNVKNVYTFSFLNKRFEFTKKRWKNKKIKSKTILKSNLFPIIFSKEKQKEVKIIKYSLTSKEALDKAIDEIKNKISANLGEKEYVNSINKLKVEENNSKIILEAFISVYEKISEEKKIEKMSDEDNV